MILSNVNIGTGPSAGDGDPLRSAFTIINNNFQIIENNVNALTNSVNSVAGRTGNVILTVNDIVGLSSTYASQANITTANTAMRGYVDGQITAANAGVTAANLGMKGYVDSQISGGSYSNINVLSYLTTNSYATQAYVNLANTIQSGQVNAANLAIIAANLGMKGYVDSVASQSIYGNSNVASYLPTYSGNLSAKYAIFTGDNGNGLNALAVGSPGIEIFGNTIAQFHSNINGPVLVSVHNKNRGNDSTAGFMVTADIGDENNYRTLVGKVGSNFTPVPGYVYPLDSTLLGFGGNLVIGSQISGPPGDPTKSIVFVVGSLGTVTEVLRLNTTDDLSSANLVLGSNVGILFNDGTRQTSAYSNVQTAAYTNLSTYAYNANVTAANLGMKGYVDSVASQSIYGNANVTAYTESMGFTNFSNVNVAAVITTNGLTNYSNVNTAAYLSTYSGNIGNISFSDADHVGGLTHTIKGHLSYISLNAPDNTRLASAGGNVEIQAGSPQWRYDTFGNLTLPSNIAAINYANGVSILSGLGSSSYSNVQVATYLSTYSGNVQSLNITANTVITGYSGTGALTVAGGVEISGNLMLSQSVNVAGNITVQGDNILAGPAATLTIGAVTTGNITASVGNFGAGNVGGFAIGYRDVPQITVANLTLIASDAGKHYYGANTNPTTITIPTNANVAFGNGTAISIVNQGTGNITVANAAGVLLYLAGNTTAGSRTLTSYGMATLIKVQVNTWFINGTGVV